jgi:hypothetical protein
MELVNSFNDKNEIGIRIEQTLAERLFQLTQGHIGLLARTLDGLKRNLRIKQNMEM